MTGAVAHLPGDILHFTYRDISDHVRRLNRYSTFQAEEIVRQKKKCLFLRLLLLPPVTFFGIISGGWDFSTVSPAWSSPRSPPGERP